MTRALAGIAAAVALAALGGCSDEPRRNTDMRGDGPGRDDRGAPREGGPVADGRRDTLWPDGSPPVACGAVPTFADGKSPTQEIHVSPSGNDTSGDGSAAKPYATIGRGAKQAKPGSAVRVHAGTYAGGAYIEGLAGTAAAPIWIGGAPGEARPTIQGGGEAMHLSRVRYVVIHDLEVSGTTQNGVNCDDGGDTANPEASRFVVFRKLYIHNVGQGGNEDCLKLSGLNDYVVVDCQFAACGGNMSGSGVDHVGCHHGVIARNEFKSMSGNAVQCKGGSEDIEVRWNVMTDAGERAVNMGGSTGFTFFRPPLSTTTPNVEARDIRVIANVIKGGTAALAFVGCVGCLAANNTIIDPKKWSLRILQETTTGGGYTFTECSGNTVVNNIFTFSRAVVSTDVNIGPSTKPDTFTFSNNLWFAHDNPGQSKPTLPVAETAPVVGQDPAFTNATSDISATSPAAGKGKAMPAVKGDIDGVCYGTPPSIGAHEK